MKTKNVKCFFAAIAATTLVVGMVAGCGNTVKADEVSKEESSGSKEIGPDLTVGFAQSGNPNPWMVALTESMQQSADEYGVNYIYTDANDDMATHVANIEDMLAKDLDILVIAPMEDTGLEAVLDRGRRKRSSGYFVSKNNSGRICNHGLF